MRLLTMFFPPAFAIFAIMLDHFLFTYTELILTISVSSSCDSASMSISTSWTAWLLLLLHTFLKCPVLLHAAHIFLYTGHCLGAWLCLQYLHGHLRCVATCTSVPQVLFDSVPFFYFMKHLYFCQIIQHCCLHFLCIDSLGPCYHIFACHLHIAGSGC